MRRLLDPEKIVSSTCTIEPRAVSAAYYVRVAWVPAENGPQRFQLQRRRPGEQAWTLVYHGPDTEYVDLVDDSDDALAGFPHRQHAHHVVYRLATWNSFGRSAHAFLRCDSEPTGDDPATLATRRTTTTTTTIPHATSSYAGTGSSASASGSGAVAANATTASSSSSWGLAALLKTYLWWLDEAIALALFIALPIRGFIYGDANVVLRLLRRLPPNMPTRVVVEADVAKSTLAEAAVKVAWTRPIDNGVPIVCYCVRWTRLKTEEVQWVKLLQVPLPTSVTVHRLRHGETYKFVVEATNQHGLVAHSSRSTYMVPVPELKGKLALQQQQQQQQQHSLSGGAGSTAMAMARARHRSVLHPPRSQCHVCHDPKRTAKVPFSATLDRRILHFCCGCDREFCHYHRGAVFHTKALSCPAVDGRCVCATCHDKTP